MERDKVPEVPGGRWLDAALETLRAPESDRPTRAQEAALVDVIRDIEAVQMVIEKAANELTAMHNSTGIDVYDRVPGLLGIIRLVYPQWADWKSPTFGRYYT
jgi:hypothetical protein